MRALTTHRVIFSDIIAGPAKKSPDPRALPGNFVQSSFLLASHSGFSGSYIQYSGYRHFRYDS